MVGLVEAVVVFCFGGGFLFWWWRVVVRSSSISRYPLSRSHDSKAGSGTLRDRGFAVKDIFLQV